MRRFLKPESLNTFQLFACSVLMDYSYCDLKYDNFQTSFHKNVSPTPVNSNIISSLETHEFFQVRLNVKNPAKG